MNLFHLIILDEDDDDVMPPAKAMKKGQVVTYKERALLRRWIEDGAKVPADISLKPKKRAIQGAPRETILPSELYKKLGFDKLAGKVQPGKSYKGTLPGTPTEYEMLAIPGGKFKRGGPGANEKPVREINVDPFWMRLVAGFQNCHSLRPG